MRDFYENEDEFDRLLREKLDDSAAFDAGQKKSWAAIDRRLDAFDAGGSGRAVELRFWKFAAAASVALAFFLGWKTWDLSQKTAVFEQKAVAFESVLEAEKSARAAAEAEILAQKTTENVVGGNANNGPKTAENENDGTRSPNAETLAQVAPFSKPSAETSPKRSPKQGQKSSFEIAPSNSPDAVFSQKKVEKKAVASAIELQKSAPNGTAKAFSGSQNASPDFDRTVQNDAPIGQKTASNGSIEALKMAEKASAEAIEKAEKSIAEAAENAAAELESTKKSAAENAAELIEKTKKAIAEAEFSKKEADVKAAEQAEKIDSLTAVLASTQAKKDSFEAVLAQKNAAEAAAPIVPIKKSTGRFRVGTEAVLGFSLPRVNGVSPLRGHGYRVEYGLKKGLSATASAHFLSYELCTDSLLRGHHDGRPKHTGGGGGNQQGPHKPPSHPKPDEFELALVKSTQHQRHFSLGLKYDFPTRGWLRPSVEAGAVGIFVPEYLLTYRFEDKKGGGPGGSKSPEYLAEDIEKETFGNIFRAGAGLAAEFPRVELSVRTSFQKDFSAATADRLADLFSIRAGVAFKF